MSASEEQAVLEFVDSRGVGDLRVANARLQTVARGVGRLEEKLPPGLYRLEAGAGPETTVRLIDLEPGSVRTELADVPVASPAPLDGTVTSHEYHQEAAVMASERLAGMGGTGLALIVRDLADRPGRRLEEAGLEDLRLVSEELDSVRLQWEIDGDLAVASSVMPLPPGGYALRIPVDRSYEHAASVYLDQAVNVVPGHQTIVFAPNTSIGPRFELASVHVVWDEWRPWESEMPGSLAAEAILEGLLTGNLVVPEFDGQAIAGNLMLGVLAVHALVLSPDPDLDRAERIAARTQTELFGGPDAAALGYVVDERRRRVERRGSARHPAPAAATPPMLRAAYDALIRYDIAGGSAIVEDSPAEAAAESLVNRGVWTTWLVALDERGHRATRGRAVPHEPVSFEIDLADIGSDTKAVQSLSPGARRVAGYLVSVAEAAAADPGDEIDHVSERQVAGACGMPIQAVRRAYEELSSMLVRV